MTEPDIPVVLVPLHSRPGAERDVQTRAIFAASAATTVSIIDLAELETVRSFMTSESFAAFLEQCIEQIARHVDDLNKLAENPDRLAALAHAMIGSAGAMGATQVAAIARRLETASATNDTSMAADLAAQIFEAWTEASRKLKLWRDFPYILSPGLRLPCA